MITLPKLTLDDEEDLQAPLELDLMAFYKSLQDELLDTIEQNKDKPIDDIIHEVSKRI